MKEDNLSIEYPYGDDDIPEIDLPAPTDSMPVRPAEFPPDDPDVPVRE